MQLIEDIIKHKSVAIVGIEKNTGKTETLNFILRHLKDKNIKVAITSIGIDGETNDAVTNTPKPEIMLYDQMLFVTAEKFFEQKRFSAEILDISAGNTIFGRIITAKAVGKGKVLLSGAPDTHSLKQIIAKNQSLGTDLTIVDGALSRLSLASPTVTDAMVLATGAAYSSNIDTLVKKTSYVCKMINMEQVDAQYEAYFQDIEDSGVYTIKENKVYRLNVKSALNISSIKKEEIEIIKKSKIMFIPGILSDRVIEFVMEKLPLKEIIIIVKDFTSIFITENKYNIFVRMGGTINVLQKSNLIGITVNPTSPQGITLNSKTLQKRLRDEIGVSVMNVKEV